MTIGIGATGPKAGLGVCRALNRVERVASGAIGGFAVFAALSADGDVATHCTQRGGSETLFIADDSVLDEPPAFVANAPVAGVISSGPDRPEPLTQFLPASDDVGLVTGHRLPNAPGTDGRPLNVATLTRLEDGTSPATAVTEVTRENPDADAGLIAVDTNGHAAAGNTATVDNRPDVSHASRRDEGVAIEVLNNSMTPGAEVAELAAAVCRSTMVGESEPDERILVRAGIEAEHGNENVVFVDENNEAVGLQTTDPTVLTGERNGAVPYLGSTVVRDGNVVGETTSEANTVLRDGTVERLSGQESVRIGVRRHE